MANARTLAAPLVKLTIFLLVTAFATYVLGVTISNKTYGGTTTYRAVFTDASGLQKGDDVRVAGVRVGTVKGISVVDQNLAQVTFDVSKDVPVPRDAEAKLRYLNLMGQRYLELDQGPSDTGALLPSDGLIPVAHTQPAVNLTDLFDGLQPLFRGLDPTQINQLSGEVISVFQGEGGSLQLLLGSLADLSNSLADRDQVIGEVIDNLGQVLTTVGQHDTQLSSLISELQGFISGLASDRGSIVSSIDGIDELTTSTASLVSRARPSLREDVPQLTRLVGNLNRSKDLGYVLQNLPPTLSGLIRATSYGSWLNFYLCSVSGTVTLPTGQALHIGNVANGNARCS